MKSVFDKDARLELLSRIHTLSPADAAIWGKMNVHQMIRHCTLWDRWISGTTTTKYAYKQQFIGFIFGKLALKKLTKNDKPLDRHVPTSSFLRIKHTDKAIEELKTDWCEVMAAYSDYDNPEFVHDFFGKMTNQQIGIFVYKHKDHHLRQFGV